MIKRALLAVIALASTAAAAYTLCLLDQIVHGTLYNYELKFSYNWANPYWSLLRIIQVLLAISIITTIAGLTLTLRPYSRTEKQHTRATPIPRMTRKIPAATRNVEKAASTSVKPLQLPSSTTTFPHQRPPQQPASKPASTLQPSTTPSLATPSPSNTLSNAMGPIRCPECGRSFTQPLRMLDFQGDKPRIVEICPFCNETMRSTPRAEGREQDGDRDKRFPIERSANHSAPKTMTQ